MPLHIEKLLNVKTIITHDSCSDGTASALLLQDAYEQAGLKPEIKFVQYGTEAYKNLKPSPNMLFCDFTPEVPEIEVTVDGERTKILDPAKLQPWLESDALILDHHKGAKALLDALGPERCVFADEETEPGVAGAMLAYQHVWLPFYAASARAAWAKKVHEGEAPAVRLGAKTAEELATQLEADLKGVPTDAHDEIVKAYEKEHACARDLAVLAGIRDTWQKTHWRWQNSRELDQVLKFYPNDDWLARRNPFKPESDEWWKERMALGALLWAKHEKSVRRCVEKSWRFTSSKGTRVLVFEGVTRSSDVAETIDTEVDLVMGFDYEVETPANGGPPNRKVIYSNRSHTTFDCKAFAKAFGGGGHTKAAGFNVTLESPSVPYTMGIKTLAHNTNPYSLAEALVQLHESKQ